MPKLHVYTGTEWLEIAKNGEDGREIELSKSSTHIQWRYVGESAWQNLISLSEIKGDRGDEGLSAYEVAVDNGFLGTEEQWIASLKGDQGDPGVVQSVVAGDNVTVDSTDPANPVVSSAVYTLEDDDNPTLGADLNTNGHKISFTNFLKMYADESTFGARSMVISNSDGSPATIYFPHSMGIYAGVQPDGSGTYYPYFELAEDGTAYIEAVATDPESTIYDYQIKASRLAHYSHTNNKRVLVSVDDAANNNAQVKWPHQSGTLALNDWAMGFVNHGSDNSVARPSGYAAILWTGAVEPVNAVDGDMWVNVT